MLRARWLRNLFRSNSSRKDRRQIIRIRKPIRLALEPLEERLTPSGINPTLTQTAGGYTALTAAIAADTAANTNYVIQITQSFQFASGGQVTISKLGAGSTLSLEGQSATLTGNGNRLFTVASGQTVRFADLTLTGGSGVSAGGAIQDLGGNVTLSKVVVEGNTVTGSSSAAGGGVYVSGAGTAVIRDSILSDNRAVGGRGADGTSAQGSAIYRDAQQGGSASGGGLYVNGGGWTVTLIGDTLSGNTVIGGDGGDGAAGLNATGSNAQGGRGGNGGDGGDALGGGAFFGFGNPVHDPLPGGYVPPYSSGHLTILNDPGAPTAYPSLMIGNSVQAGNGGAGAAGGNSTGTANNSNGGWGGRAATASGGGVYISSFLVGGTFTADIGNSTFFGNSVTGGNGGAGGAAGTGGTGAPGTPGVNAASGFTAGGGVGINLSGGGALTMVNSTVAQNILTAGLNSDGTSGGVEGGGLYDTGTYNLNTGTFDNNTITRNTVKGATNAGSGVSVEYGLPVFFNNLIQGNQSLGSSAPELSTRTALNNASNNFITSISANAVSTATNIVGNPQVQLGSTVGVDATGNPTGGPVYYPLLPGVVSIGAGNTRVLSTIATVEGTTPANAVDPLGNPMSRNGSLDLGAVQILSTPGPAPSPPALSPFQLLLAITLDVDALAFQNFPPALSFLNSISEHLLGQPLPPMADLLPTVEGDLAAFVNLVFGSIEGDIAAMMNSFRRA